MLCRQGLPWELLFADDRALTAETEANMQEKWQNWQEFIEPKELKVNAGKTKVMVSSRSTITKVLS